MKWILFLCCLATAAVAAPAPAPAPAPPPSTSEAERYLFLVETSGGMRRFDTASRQALFDMIHWGIDGHMQGGDTYGLWTYNSEVQSGIFSMQLYDVALQLPLATRASLFLKDQTYENKTDTSHLVLKLLSVVMTVKDLNIFVITDAEIPIIGLGFDNEIKAACEARRKDARRARKPFIITMIARNGAIGEWTVTLPGEPIKLPERRPLVAKEIAKASATTNTVQRAPVPSINMVAAKPAPLSVESQPQVRAAAESTPETAETTELIVVSNSETNESQPAPSAKVITVTAAPLNAPNNERTLEAQRAAAAAAVEAEIVHRVSNQIARLTQVAADAAMASQARPIPATVPPSSSPIIVAAREPGIASPAVFSGSSRGLDPLLSATELVIAGIVLLGIAAGLIVVLLRRTVPLGHGSYITRSMDR